MAFSTALATLALCAAAGVAAIYAALQTRRLRRAQDQLEASADALWEAEGRAERLQADGVRALVDAEARARAGVRAKARFLATVSHEMRTPLSGVIGTAQLMLESRLAPEQRTYASAIAGSAEAMLALVDEILDVSRLEAEAPAMQPASFSIAGLVEEVGELLAPRAQAKGLDFAIFVSRDAPHEIIADVARVRQILLNLAGNAIKFTAAGGVGLRVDRVETGVRFLVRDTGPGFDPADAERLFQEFEQGAGSAAGGVGLGLAISRRLAEAMGGALTGDAAPGAGAAFTLTLTLPLPQAAAPAPAPQPLSGRRAMVISTSPFSGPWLVESLVGLGGAAGIAGPATAADLERLLENEPADIVVIDRDSAADVDALASAARRAGATRVLLMLSPAERGDLAAQLARGFDGYLVKPVRAASLVSRIEGPGDIERGPSTEASPAIVFPAGGLRVLVAEDDPVSALIALAHLARLGHFSVHVSDGATACETFERENFDAVLLDLRMPLLDGCEAARRMRASEAASGRRPAILLALTANIGAEDREAALAAGMDGLMPKPLDRRALETVLEPLRADNTRAA